MTRTIDNLLIKTGVNADDLKSVNYRPVLYLGIAAEAAFAFTFAALAFAAWT